VAGVLDGIKVLDFTQVYSGPFCTLLLRDLGAEIIKVERPGSGDLTRNDVPHTEGNEGGPYIILNRGKQSITLDLKTKKGCDVIRDLVKKVDVLVENFSPGTMDKLGLNSQAMCALNPGLIYASISAYGQTGPKRDYPGFDPVAQAMGGMTSVTGCPDAPTRCGSLVSQIKDWRRSNHRYIYARFYLAINLHRIFTILFPFGTDSSQTGQRTFSHDSQQLVSH
jgi:CoA:oxalate CoA-transferase